MFTHRFSAQNVKGQANGRTIRQHGHRVLVCQWSVHWYQPWSWPGPPAPPGARLPAKAAARAASFGVPTWQNNNF